MASIFELKFHLYFSLYRYPLQCNSLCIRPILSDVLKDIYKGLIFKGGIFGVVPAKEKKWNEAAVEYVEKMIHGANDILFRCKGLQNDHVFGSLIIISNRGKEIVEDKMRSLKEGTYTLRFFKG